MARSLTLLAVSLVLAVIAIVPLAADSIASNSDIELHSLLLSRSYAGWVQVNESGFGDAANDIWSLTAFDSHLYAGTCRESAAQLWRSANGTTWSQATIPAWPSANECILDAMPFGSYLYLGVLNMNGAQIWRTNGTTWEKVAEGGLGNAENIAVSAFAVFNNNIYAVAGNFASGNSLWRSATGAVGTWQQVPIGAMGGLGTFPEVTLDVFGSYLYLGQSRNGQAELWRSTNGVSWTPVLTGAQTVSNTHVSAMAVFGGQFYIGFRNPTGGAQVWRSTNGVNWSPVFTDGLGKVGNSRAYGLIVYNNRLYVVFGNYAGAEVWRTGNGIVWEPVAQGGWGDASASFADYFDKAAAVFQNRLYIATTSGPSGGEIWKKTITADFMASPTMGPPPLSVAFTNTSAGDYTASTWTFGDGGTSTLINPTRVYNNVGTYTVTLTIGDGVETSTITRTAYIRAWHRLYTPVIVSN